jgi:hypothetical protein
MQEKERTHGMIQLSQKEKKYISPEICHQKYSSAIGL